MITFIIFTLIKFSIIFGVLYYFKFNIVDKSLRFMTDVYGLTKGDSEIVYKLKLSGAVVIIGSLIGFIF